MQSPTRDFRHIENIREKIPQLLFHPVLRPKSADPIGRYHPYLRYTFGRISIVQAVTQGIPFSQTYP
jgi:hypothetical protein